MIFEHANYFDKDFTLKNGHLHVHESGILEITNNNLRTSSQTIDASGFLVLPGFVNAHFHSQSIAGPGLFRESNFTEWGNESTQGRLQSKFFEFVDKRATDEEFEALCLKSYLNLIRQGVTFTQDSGFGERSPRLLQSALEKLGMRGHIDA